MEQVNQLDRLLKIAEVSNLVGLGKSAIYDMITAGSFPAPIKIGCASRWSLLEVVQWIEDRKRERAA
ncbi:AlpA family phage regulatory protein [Pseudomonas sp. GD04087]|uniref:helix-turn-helix transcriptional regulator n=1 Tax=unclassified Pseudomonas TaxID=196821 RepID=UPI002447D96E|nr:MULTISPECIES: AlpA family phage regulatory protein [unclassified Pseudomonas]MDH0291429.1 AlpA family phage regulatory protein [Pseudomonas sp. GD04087]MDH1051741.1 AlpA family phage regulatory protein [Pseudomonas sp. GD03903]MDH2001725.1 AlpA family phage regulatory protein [Pseudomonas sp. GD03691]